MLWNSDQIYIDLWKVIWIQVSTSHWTQELQSTTDPGQPKVLKSRENYNIFHTTNVFHMSLKDGDDINSNMYSVSQ